MAGGGASAAAQGLVPARSQFMDSMQLDPETVDNLDMYSHIPPVLMEKCAALSVRPDTVKNLVQSMQGKVTGGCGTPVRLLAGARCRERPLQSQILCPCEVFNPKSSLLLDGRGVRCFPAGLDRPLAAGASGLERMGAGGLVAGTGSALSASVPPSQCSPGSSPTWRPP